jgi:transcription elongation factor Elf1
MKCPTCAQKITAYCTKYKVGKKQRYYYCKNCNTKFVTRVEIKEWVIKKDRV